MENINNKKRNRVDSDEFDLGSVEVKKLKDDFLDLLDVSDLSSTTQDLDSFIKSFEDEIKLPSSLPLSAVDLKPDSSNSIPELGFLIGASDDELGLPPSTTTTDKNVSDLGLGELFGLGDELSYFDSLDGGIEQGNVFVDNSEFDGLDGLFDYSELGIESAEFLWHPETMPAQ